MNALTSDDMVVRVVVVALAVEDNNEDEFPMLGRTWLARFFQSCLSVLLACLLACLSFQGFLLRNNNNNDCSCCLTWLSSLISFVVPVVESVDVR